MTIDHDDGMQAALRTAALERQATAARHQASVLLGLTQTLVRNGVDLRNPERLDAFARDEVLAAIGATNVSPCGCGITNGAAAVALLAEMARRLAEATR